VRREAWVAVPRSPTITASDSKDTIATMVRVSDQRHELPDSAGEGSSPGAQNDARRDAFAVIPPLDPAELPEEVGLDLEVSAAFLRQHTMVPVREVPEGLVIAVADPVDYAAVEALALATRRPLILRRTAASTIQELIDRVYGANNTMQQIVEDLASDVGDATTFDSDDLDRLKDLAGEAPVIRLVNHLIAEAARRHASDIHIEPYPARLAVRLRIDGMLIDMTPPPARLAKAVVSRIKILARLNIAERRLPQDGRIRHVVDSQALDLRVSTLPTVHGESVVIRLLPVHTGIRDLAAVGLPAPLQRVLRRLAEAPHGLILVTGPTGSGKTTTLYATLQLINTPERKVLTVEDPVEYQMEGVNQVQVRPSIELTFARILRSMLRQDPDVIMVGEMRDSETATIAIHAALTGHLVLSTLHTNDAPSAVTRLIDMNIEPFLLASTIRTVIAQRLVRVLCSQCRQPAAPAEDFLAVLAASGLSATVPGAVYAAHGCEACNGTGYSGRIGVFEMMMMSDAVRRLTIARASANDIARAAKADGMTTMLEDGLSKVLAGVTTFEEVRRVTES
jgi:general secretion pathway protein E